MIAIYMPKSAKTLCAMLGILYSGNTYVPMDTRAPIKRTLLILDIARPTLIITDGPGKKQLLENGADENIIFEYNELSGAEIIDNLPSLVLMGVKDTDPACLLFTSGSTGVPKGVVIPHLRVINYINWAKDYFGIKNNEIIGSQAPFYFTVSAMDIYLTLATGSRLNLIPENLFSNPKNLVEYLDKQAITLIFWVSSVYHHLAQSRVLEDGTESLKALKRVWFVGEPMPAQSLYYLINHLPNADFTNLYGATETDMTICYDVPKDYNPDSPVPLGHPCANTEILLLKEDLTSAALGETGEICVGGSCLALGYYKNLEKTQRAFIQNPLNDKFNDIIYRTGDLGEIKDGLIYFHGRRDHQFKHLGYRIEAGEIEAAASKFPGINHACVIYDDKKRQIVLFYEAAGETDELKLRRELMAALPVYMVPTRFIALSAMPFNQKRKKDRIALKNQYLEEK
jgi:amino acid adenylation domain-containing protein